MSTAHTTFTELGALPSSVPDLQDAVRHLRLPSTVRERCANIANAVAAGRSSALTLDRSRMAELARRVSRLIQERHPGPVVPPHSCWRYLDAGGVDRPARLAQRLAGLDPAAAARVRVELAVVCVLLDGPAGPEWQYRDAATGRGLGRAEGLAAATFDAFMAGRFSSDTAQPLRVDAPALLRLDAAALGEALQARDGNPLVGLEGRLRLLHRLATVMQRRRDVFGEPARPGALFDLLGHVLLRGPDGRPQKLPVHRLRAAVMLRTLLKAFGPIWPGGSPLGGKSLGDVWAHPLAGGSGASAGHVPFHTYSQWLALSLVEPLAVGGIEIDALDELTGLAGLRHGGLFLDAGVIVPREGGFAQAPHMPGDGAIVEWRALSLVLLDDLLRAVRAELRRPELGMSGLLEGGVVAAGRGLAAERRPGGPPPLRVSGFGTIL